MHRFEIAPEYRKKELGEDWKWDAPLLAIRISNLGPTVTIESVVLEYATAHGNRTSELTQSVPYWTDDGSIAPKTLDLPHKLERNDGFVFMTPQSWVFESHPPHLRPVIEVAPPIAIRVNTTMGRSFLFPIPQEPSSNK
jgi:hypothetical protein